MAIRHGEKYYFGCWGSECGHYLKDKFGKRIDFEKTPWINKIDGVLCPKKNIGAGAAKINYRSFVGGRVWTALAFWDYSVDERPGSNSIFIFQGKFNFKDMIKIAKDNFPDIFRRFDFEIIQEK